MTSIKVKVAGTALMTAVLLTGSQWGNVSTAQAASNALPVKATLSQMYDIGPDRLYFDPATGYLQIDGQNVLKPFVKNGVSYASSSEIAQAAVKANKQEPLNFVLIHGSWSDASFWDKTVVELKRNGHAAYAPEYAGHGKQYDPKVAHEAIVESIVNDIKAKKLTHIVLVGHSFGGSIIQKVAEQIPDRIDRLVFFDAFVPLDGQSVADQLPPELQGAFGQLIEASGNNTIPMPYPLFRDGFVNLASDSLAKQIYQSAKPEPATPLLQKLDLKKFYNLHIPKSYLYLTSDMVAPQGEKYSFHPAQSSHLGQFRLITGDGDHMSTAYSKPAYLEKKLYEAARK
ncbi:alpha/beta fold hydrolase [Paenibacillus sp. CF384]|uniref:alpha/beta fold hydrolase n=1 Tax=Paenibacillus sp. CF384 TaxID=1884382 RepID=UPI00089787A4|nr:alpha/beta hydrolase [Paenibacillus sp. CF384]SDW80539.1 Alpha/beta hydrolase family protein [Paenibacillus sp. CF384]